MVLDDDTEIHGKSLTRSSKLRQNSLASSNVSLLRGPNFLALFSFQRIGRDDH